MPTFKEQVEELFKESKIIKEEINTDDLELSSIDCSLNVSIENITDQTIKKLFEKK